MSNPYSSPENSSHLSNSEINNTQPALELWNPEAAACWSLVFTPVFGSIIISKNWRRIGNTEEATYAKNWVYISLIAILGSIVLQFTSLAGSIGQFLPIVFLLLWYFCSAKRQAKYLKNESVVYQKKSWFRPLAISSPILLTGFLLTTISIPINIPTDLAYPGLEDKVKELVNQIIQKQFKQTTTCTDMEVEEIAEGRFYGTATLNDGTKFDVNVTQMSTQLLVELSPDARQLFFEKAICRTAVELVNKIRLKSLQFNPLCISVGDLEKLDESNYHAVAVMSDQTELRISIDVDGVQMFVQIVDSE